MKKKKLLQKPQLVFFKQNKASQFLLLSGLAAIGDEKAKLPALRKQPALNSISTKEEERNKKKMTLAKREELALSLSERG